MRRQWAAVAVVMVSALFWAVGTVTSGSLPWERGYRGTAVRPTGTVAVSYRSGTLDRLQILSIRLPNAVSVDPTPSLSASPSGAIFTGSNVRPGDSFSGTVTITNTSGASEQVSLSESNLSHGPDVTPDLSAQLRLTIVDTTTSTTIYDGAPFNGLAPNTVIPPVTGTGWAANESHSFTFTVFFPGASGNEFQSTSASVDFVWSAQP